MKLLLETTCYKRKMATSRKPKTNVMTIINAAFLSFSLFKGFGAEAGFGRMKINDCISYQVTFRYFNLPKFIQNTRP